MINLLVHYGADPLILNYREQSALHIACALNRLSIVRELLALTHSSLLEIKDYRGQTALSVTTHIDIIHELITFGADISSLDNNHMNVLMIAISKSQRFIVEYLLHIINKQQITIFDQVTKQNDRSLFLIAIQTGSIEMCSLLFNYSYIHWNTIDKQRMNLFHIAVQNNYPQLIEFLCQQIKKSNSRYYSITTTNNDRINCPQSSSILHLYLDAQNEDGQTPLHLAVEQDYVVCVEILLKYYANSLLPNYLGQLPLHVAIQNGHSQCVDLLIQISTRNIVDFQVILSRKQSPLIIACRNGFVNIVRLLLFRNCGIDHNINEENPLEIAIKYRHIEIIHTLLEHTYAEYWLKSIRTRKNYFHQTPLRDMIRYIPECAKHTFDKLTLTTNEIDRNGNRFERIRYNYTYIDDYFM